MVDVKKCASEASGAICSAENSIIWRNGGRRSGLDAMSADIETNSD